MTGRKSKTIVYRGHSIVVIPAAKTEWDLHYDAAFAGRFQSKQEALNAGKRMARSVSRNPRKRNPGRKSKTIVYRGHSIVVIPAAKTEWDLHYDAAFAGRFQSKQEALNAGKRMARSVSRNPARRPVVRKRTRKSFRRNAALALADAITAGIGSALGNKVVSSSSTRKQKRRKKKASRRNPMFWGKRMTQAQARKYAREDWRKERRDRKRREKAARKGKVLQMPKRNPKHSFPTHALKVGNSPKIAVGPERAVKEGASILRGLGIKGVQIGRVRR